jgi:hypothetical protein
MKPVYTLRVLHYLPVSVARRLKSIATLFIIASSVFLLTGRTARAEGTKQVMPNATNGTGLIVSTTASFPLGNVGPYLGAPVDQRVYIRIGNFSNEVLYYGFNWETLSPNTPINTYSDVYMNIFDPTGALVTTVHLPGAAAAGFISTYASAVIGPKIGGVPVTGYNPLTFTPTMNGDYYVTFYRSTDGGVTHIAGGESMLAKYFDLTVVQGGNSRLTGRVHCTEWAFSVYNPASSDIQDPMTSTNAQFYPYSNDSVVTRIYFPASGYKPLSYIVAANTFGVNNSGNWAVDRQSINLPHLVSPYLTGGFPVFLNPPDATYYPPCAIPNPPVLVNPTISGCPPGPFNLRFQAPQAGDFYILLDLNGVPGYQPNSADRFIELIGQSAGIIVYPWDGKDGLGNPVPANFTFPITFSYRKGRINLPMYDVELNVNGFSVDAVSPIGAVNTTLYWDDSQLTSMGTDCSNNNNNYTGIGYSNIILGQASPGHAWNGNGNPGFAVPAPAVAYSGVNNDADNVQCNDFGNARLINTWAWGIVLNTTQTVTLSCITVSGTVWDDADGSAAGGFSNIKTNSEVGTNAGNLLYANLIDPVTGTVMSSVAVNADGTYTLANVPINASNLKIVIATTQGTYGGPAPSPSLPSNWVNTSPITYTFSSGTSPITRVDFGIEQVPNSNDQTYTIAVPTLNSFLTLNGTGSISSPGPLAGADFEDGTMGSGKKVVIISVPTNEQLFYNGTRLGTGTTISNYNPALLQIKFTNNTVATTSFQYAFVDAANIQDPSPATYTINMSTALATSLSGFAGKATDQGNVLTWTGYNETTGLYYTVERSADAHTFSAIARVNGSTNGATGNHLFTDKSPAVNTTNYYRLQYTDLSGAIGFSNIISIGAPSDAEMLDVAPNPFHDQVTIHLNLPKMAGVTVRLIDSKGVLLRQGEYQCSNGMNTLQIGGLTSLPVSVYFIQIVLPDKVLVRKLSNR